MKMMTIKVYNPDTDQFREIEPARAQSSPWGRIQVKYKYKGKRGRAGQGLHFIVTAGHGGFMISRRFAEKNLSAEAINQGSVYGGYLCYEEDCAADIIRHELGDLVNVAHYSSVTSEDVIDSLCRWYPQYVVDKQIDLNAGQEKVLKQELNRGGLVAVEFTTGG